MFYYYDGEKPENPCKKCWYKNACSQVSDDSSIKRNCVPFHVYKSLSKLVEVDLDEKLKKYDAYRHEFTGTYDEWIEKGMPIPMTFEQFIQQQIQEEDSASYADRIRKTHKSNLTIHPMEALNDKDS